MITHVAAAVISLADDYYDTKTGPERNLVYCNSNRIVDRGASKDTDPMPTKATRGSNL